MIAGVIALCSAVALAGTVGLPARFRAVVFDTEAGRSAPLEISITRWSTPEEVERLSSAFNDQGPDGLLRRLQQAPRVGSWRTPGSLASDLRFAQQTPDKNGGWRVMLMTDRHMGFGELASLTPSTQYPLTVIELHVDSHGEGTGTIWPAARINYWDPKTQLVVVDNYTLQPLQLMGVRLDPRPTV
jgi:hypothetical protein